MSITDELREYIWQHATNNEELRAIADRIDAEHEKRSLSYEEAKQLCMKAFDGGITYGTESMRYSVDAVAYNWDHWLKEHKSLFRPKPTVEDLLEQFALEIDPGADISVTGAVSIKKFAAKLQLKESE